MPEFEILDAVAADSESISYIEKECFSQPLSAEQILTQINDEKYILICVKDSAGVILGYTGMYCVLDEGYIVNVAVSPKARRMHAADALMDELEKRSTGMGLSFITLEVRKSNDPAIELYKKHGYVTAGIRKNYYLEPREDALIMTKYLK